MNCCSRDLLETLEFINEAEPPPCTSDLIEDLSKRLHALVRYRHYGLRSKDQPPLQRMWQEFRRQELENIRRLKQLLVGDKAWSCF